MIIHIINGPNLNLVGKREPEIYGSKSLIEFHRELRTRYPKDELHYFQSNHEGSLLDYLHNVGYDDCGIILNAGAFTHTSIALGDAIKGINAPVVEVHISNIYEREAFRQISFVKDACINSIVGQGIEGYALAIDFLKEKA